MWTGPVWELAWIRLEETSGVSRHLLLALPVPPLWPPVWSCALLSLWPPVASHPDGTSPRRRHKLPLGSIPYSWEWVRGPPPRPIRTVLRLQKDWLCPVAVDQSSKGGPRELAHIFKGATSLHYPESVRWPSYECYQRGPEN